MGGPKVLFSSLFLTGEWLHSACLRSTEISNNPRADRILSRVYLHLPNQVVAKNRVKKI